MIKSQTRQSKLLNRPEKKDELLAEVVAVVERTFAVDGGLKLLSETKFVKLGGAVLIYIKNKYY
jgi:hypothetical protein